ncbi:chemotaxis protein CheW [Parasphingopyxis algicola]|uniref:chemotaxis protein CheW n=1 Tax=Parasphingopyxis algicola TaxID=2026624 RepID=UPI0015A3F4C4|nr:chemotaxis protein CheW [Parasphingopyxis algicola]QLC24310.1 chemotaxis protein CheW [Parasphingopyxis algicola]
MDKLYLIAEAGGSNFAIEADVVESVVTASEVIPVPLAEPRVAGVAALRSKVITVIDTMAVIDDRPASVEKGRSLVVVKVDDFLYGLAVDTVHDVRECSARPERLGAAFEPGWRRISTGVIEIDDHAVAVVDPAALVLAPEAEAA